MSLLEKRIKKLSDGLSSAVAKLGDQASPKSVHRLRTTIRRIESLIAYTHPDLGKKQQKALEDLGALRKRAGKVRDLDVQMSLLGAMANGSTAGDRRVLTDLLKGKRERQAARLSSAARKLQASKFFVHLDRIGQEAGAAASGRDASATPMEQARQQLSNLAAEFISQQPIRPRLLHEVRIRMKMIRYLAELGEETAEQQRLLAKMKSVQDALGDWHDWEEVAKTTEKQFGDRANCPLLAEVRALFAARYSAATAAVAQLFSTASAPAARKEPRPAESPSARVQRA
jgi:CHAD domain-containing protein